MVVSPGSLLMCFGTSNNLTSELNSHLMFYLFQFLLCIRHMLNRHFLKLGIEPLNHATALQFPAKFQWLSLRKQVLAGVDFS